MSWFFEKKDNNSEIAARIEQVEERLRQINASVLEVSNGVAESLRQQAESSSQLTKLMRLQYKSGQETRGTLEELTHGLLEVRQWQAQYGDFEARAEEMGRQRQCAVDALVAQLDDLDHIFTGLGGAMKETWQPVLQGWAQRIVTALAEMGIYEIKVLGQTFDPQIAEGVGVKDRPKKIEARELDETEIEATEIEATEMEARGLGTTHFHVPYEVAEVVKRGFSSAEGQLLRKAQVITFQEGLVKDE